MRICFVVLIVLPDLDLDAAFRMLTGQPDAAQSSDALVFSGLIGVLDPEREVSSFRFFLINVVSRQGVKQAIATAGHCNSQKRRNSCGDDHWYLSVRVFFRLWTMCR